jgi:hypothetical protein
MHGFGRSFGERTGEAVVLHIVSVLGGGRVRGPLEGQSDVEEKLTIVKPSQAPAVVRREAVSVHISNRTASRLDCSLPNYRIWFALYGRPVRC